MTINTGLSTKAGFVVETTYGTTPSTPSMTTLPFTSFGVNLTRDEYEDNSIHPDRMETYSLSGNRTVAGTIEGNLSHGYYDALFESLMQSTFTSNVLKTGVTRKSFSIEEAALDISEYRVYSGVIVDKCEINIPSSGTVTVKFDVIGKDQSALTSTSIDADGYTDPTAKVPFTDYSASGYLKEAGTAIGNVTSVAFTIDNGYTKNFAVMSNVVRDLTTGNSKITGTITVFFEDAVMYNKFVNGTASSLDVKLSDGTNSYEFSFGNIKYTGATKTISGNGAVTLAMPFKALKNAADNSHVVITKST
jgi:hypothetical protein